MKSKIILQLLMFFFLTSALASSVSPRSFEVYVHTNFQNQPDLLKYGIKYLRFTGTFWKKGQDRKLLPQKDRVIEIVAKNHGDHTGLMAIDIEKWGSLTSSSEAAIAEQLEKRLTVLDWVKQGAPKATVGYYSVIPVQGGYRAKSPADYERWRKNNDRVQAFTDRLPVLFPSFYAASEDQNHWVKYATDLLKESRRIGKGKPVYLVINPRYHAQACCGLAKKYVSKEFFAFQLKTLKDLGYNGVVIWQWASSNHQWGEDRHSQWWQATKEFLGTN